MSRGATNSPLSSVWAQTSERGPLRPAWSLAVERVRKGGSIISLMAVQRVGMGILVYGIAPQKASGFVGDRHPISLLTRCLLGEAGICEKYMLQDGGDSACNNSA